MSINYSSNDNAVSKSTLSITAEGTSIASSTIIGDNSVFNVLGTCTNVAYALRLPEHPELGKSFLVKNNGLHMASVFPFNATSSIDSLGAGEAFVLANNGSEASFVAVQSTPLASNTSTIAWVAFGKSGHGVIAAAANVTLQSSPNFDNIVNITQSSDFTITLPAPAAGNIGMRVRCNLRVIGAYTVDVQGGDAGKVTGIVLQDSATGTQADHVEGAAKLSIDFDDGCVVGDRVDCLCDGTQWCVQGFSSATDKMTWTA